MKNPKWIGLLASQLDIPTEEVSDFILWDFVDQGKAIPSFADLKQHIEYQLQLSSIGNSVDWDEHAFADAWCRAF
jgi:hypothetical protein